VILALAASMLLLMGPGSAGILMFPAILSGALLPARETLATAVLLAAGIVLFGDGDSWELAAVAVAMALWMHAFFSNIRLTVQLRAAQEELAVVAVAQERRRIARDLHDILGHSLTAISVKSALAQRLVGSDPERATQEAGEVGQIARGALADVHDDRVAVARLLRQQGQDGGPHVAPRTSSSSSPGTVSTSATASAGTTGAAGTEATRSEPSGAEATGTEPARAEATGTEASGTTEAARATASGTELTRILLIVVLGAEFRPLESWAEAWLEPRTEARTEACVGECAAPAAELCPPAGPAPSEPSGVLLDVHRRFTAVCLIVPVVVPHGVSVLGAAVVRLRPLGV
jgi:hypothetical protein